MRSLAILSKKSDMVELVPNNITEEDTFPHSTSDSTDADNERWSDFYSGLFNAETGRFNHDELYKGIGRIMRDALLHGYTEEQCTPIEELVSLVGSPANHTGRMFSNEKELYTRVGTAGERLTRYLSGVNVRSVDFVNQRLGPTQSNGRNKASAYNLMEKVWARLTTEQSTDFLCFLPQQ